MRAPSIIAILQHVHVYHMFGSFQGRNRFRHHIQVGQDLAFFFEEELPVIAGSALLHWDA
jgi:hypothetical protein